MKDFSCNVNLLNSNNIYETIIDGKCAIDLIYGFLEKMNFREVIFLVDENDTADYKYRTKKIKNNALSIVNSFLQTECLDIFFIDITNPLLNVSLNDLILSNHKQYKNDFTFAIGFPQGLYGYAISKSIVNSLCNLIDENMPIYDSFLYDIIKKDINNFDVDGEISPVDTRMLKIDLTTKTMPELMYLKNIATVVCQKDYDNDFKKVLDYLVKYQNLLYTIPNYYKFQISGDCPFSCIYCPYKPNNNFMNLEDFKKVIGKINSITNNYYVSLSLYGEPAFSQHVYSIIEFLENDKNVKEIVIETTGIGWDFEKIKLTNIKKTKFIINVDTVNKEKYLKNRVNSVFKNYLDMENFLNFMISNYKSNTYIQTVRIDDYEDEILTFFKWAKEKIGDNVIIQKFINYNDIPKLSSLDISPAKREHCFHLRREMCVMSNGDVLRCFKDIDNTVGNILKEDIDVIVKKLKVEFDKNTKDKLCEICKSCDDYYTFEF